MSVERSVRLLEIDGPERGRPFFAESKQFMADLLSGENVAIIPGVEPVDRYGRTLTYVYLNGQDVALLVAQPGYAELKTTPPNDERADLYIAAVAGVKSAKKGMWTSLEGRFRNSNCSAFKTQEAAQAFFEEAQPAQRLDLPYRHVRGP